MPKTRRAAALEKENEKINPSKRKKPAEKSTKKCEARPNPKWTDDDFENLFKLFLSLQKTTCNTHKLFAEITKYYEKERVQFMKVLLRAIKLFLNQNEAYNKISSCALKNYAMFIASFGDKLTQAGDSHPIIKESIEEIATLTSDQQHIRSRICQFVASFLNSLPPNGEISDALMDLLVDRMTKFFVRDHSPVVRQNAIFAMHRLQDPRILNDVVTKTLLFHMASDPSVKVRKSCITTIAKHLSSLPHVIERISDCDETVRRHACLELSEIPMKSLEIIDALEILSICIHDRSEMVKTAARNFLLPSWASAYDNIANFVGALMQKHSHTFLMHFRELAKDIVVALLNQQTLKEIVEFLKLSGENEFNHCPPSDEAGNLVSMVLWKVVVKFGTKMAAKSAVQGSIEEKEPDHQDLSVQLPELSVLCDFIDNFMNNFEFPEGTTELKYQMMTFNLCITTLLDIVALNDFSDEVGRNRLKNVMRNILINHNVSKSVIKAIADIIELDPDTNQNIKFFIDIISELVDFVVPGEFSRKTIVDTLIANSNVETNLKASQLKAEMLELKEQERIFVEQRNFSNLHLLNEHFSNLNQELVELLLPIAENSSTSVADLTSTLGTKKLTGANILKNLRICFYMLMMKCVRKLTPELMLIYNGFVRYHLESPDNLVREWALKSAVAFNMLYKPLAKDVYYILKLTFFRSSYAIVWETAVNGIVDLLLRYGIEQMESIIQDDTNDSDSNSDINIISMLTTLADNSSETRILKAAFTGIGKLVLHGLQCDPALVSRLMLAFLDPSTDAEITQILSVFFDQVIIRKRQSIFLDALVPTLKMLIEAPPENPLSEVKVDVVIKYVISVTRPTFCRKGLNLHNILCLRLIEFLEEQPNDKNLVTIISKEMKLLNISDDPSLKRQMASKIEALLLTVKKDSRFKANLSDFGESLKKSHMATLA